jgi:hypothetical protein
MFKSQAGYGFLFNLGKQGLDVVLDYFIERGLLGSESFVGSRGIMWDNLTGFRAVFMVKRERVRVPVFWEVLRLGRPDGGGHDLQGRNYGTNLLSLEESIERLEISTSPRTEATKRGKPAVQRGLG